MVELGKSLNRKITGVVHGAGLEDSKLVADKDHDIFDRVVELVRRLDFTYGCCRGIRDKSIEVRCLLYQRSRLFGNGGQTDYAAANSVLDAEMARLTASGMPSSSHWMDWLERCRNGY